MLTDAGQDTLRGYLTHLVAFVDQLMSACNKLQAVHVVELGGHLISKQPASTSRGYSPGTHILRVTPDKIAEGAFMRDLLGTSDDTNLIQCADLGTQTTVDAKNFAIHNGSKNQEVEDLAAAFPHRGIAVLLLALFIEAIDLGDLARLVISTHEGDPIRVSDCRLSTKCLLK